MAAKRKRDYRKEYDEFHGKKEQIGRRGQRNKKRDEEEKKGTVHKGDGKEVDHVGANRKGRLGSKVRVISKKANRKKQPKRDGSQD